MRDLVSLLPAIVPLAVGVAAVLRGVDVFSAMADGARRGFSVMERVLPSLVCLLPAVYMLRASGALDALTRLAAPVLEKTGIPAEAAGLMLLRPLSGSAALAAGSELMARYGPDSVVGRTAAVMLGSTETTFYVLTVYFGGLEIKSSRRAVAAALIADAVGFLAAARCARLF